jgi:hypothetical protein
MEIKKSFNYSREQNYRVGGDVFISKAVEDGNVMFYKRCNDMSCTS